MLHKNKAYFYNQEQTDLNCISWRRELWRIYCENFSRRSDFCRNPYSGGKKNIIAILFLFIRFTLGFGETYKCIERWIYDWVTIRFWNLPRNHLLRKSWNEINLWFSKNTNEACDLWLGDNLGFNRSGKWILLILTWNHAQRK